MYISNQARYATDATDVPDISYLKQKREKREKTTRLKTMHSEGAGELSGSAKATGAVCM